MRNPSASSSSSPSLTPFCFLLIYLLLSENLTNGEGAESIIKLPRFQGFRTNRLTSKRVLNVNYFGAKGNGLNDDTQAFKDAWELACSLPSRSRIEIPAGNTYLVGPIDFPGPCRSKVTLRVSGDIVAPTSPDVWEGLNPRKWLYFHGVKHLTVEGGGVINGMGEEWWSRSCKVNISNVIHMVRVSLTKVNSISEFINNVYATTRKNRGPCRHAPTAITFHKCKDLRVRNLMMLNSQQMHMAFTSCIRVRASHLKVIAPVDSPNTDGIHISASSRVEVRDSRISTGDDCISIVNNSSRLRIREILCTAGHGISIGSLGKSNSWAQVHDVSVERVFLSNTDNGVRIKTWQGGSGFAEGISFRYVMMKNVSNPIIIDQYYCDSQLPCANQTSAVKVDNISFVGIFGTSATEEAIRVSCSDSYPCERIYLKDILLLPSYTGGITTAFCWKAMGSSRGLVYPSSCFSCSESFIKQKALPTSGHLSF